MKIIFLNQWHAKLRDQLVDFILKQKDDTDIFCFQEVYESRRLLDFIYDNYNKYSGDKLLQGDENYSNETFVKNTISVNDWETITTENPDIGLGIHTKLDIKGKIINICNYHGLPRPGHKRDTPERIQQSEEILKYYKDIKGPKIIGGDFNLDIKSKSIALFEDQGYINLIDKYEIKTTRNKYAWDKFPKTKQYYADFVFTTPDVKINNFEVIENEISDHLPMILEFEI